ncbi:MAG: hypothetical protein CMG74_05630 [Candidatus Marinimicrobia bacterium]|nr:hypothetical protein [Candidatus Neomarinimicrobiota bacterium]|tara:strand:+ start:1044 stop:1427 length:384 start_codon:yes stop_codon:yes gene_type:complete
MNKKIFWKIYKKKILLWIFTCFLIGIAIHFGIDKKIIIFISILFGIFTQLFAGLAALITLIPVIGPLIVKIVTIPGFFLLNALGTIVSGIAIRKGYTEKLARGRVVTLGIMVGIIIGYIIGNLLPLK